MHFFICHGFLPKEIVNPKMRNPSSFTHPRVIPNSYDFLLFLQNIMDKKIQWKSKGNKTVWLSACSTEEEFSFSVDYAFKGIVHPKMKIKSLITHPHAVPTP